MFPASDLRILDESRTCYHCGEPIPHGVDLSVEVGGVVQAMCCPGCRAVASLIAHSGLENFYRQRTAYSERPQRAEPTAVEQYRVYDDPQLAATFTTTDDNGLVNASLLLGGISCAACTWLIEQSLAGLPGVTRALVNLQQARLDIQFDPGQRQLSDIFARLEGLGYRPRPFQSSTARQQSAAEYRTDLRRLAVAGLGMMQVGMFAIALHAGDIQGIDARYAALLRWVSLPVAAFVVFYSARPFFTSAWRHLKKGALVMDLPVALAIGLAFLASAWATVSSTGQVYFDSVVMFTFLLLLARFLERRVRQRQLFTWLDAESSLPSAVVVRRDEQWISVARIALRAGETFMVKAGETVPVDAQICQGDSAVKEDTFNGEPLPRSVAAGDTVYAGTVNVAAALQAKVLATIVTVASPPCNARSNEAQTSKPRLATLADRMASWFVGRLLLVTRRNCAGMAPAGARESLLDYVVSIRRQLPLRPGAGDAGRPDQRRQCTALARCNRAWRECAGIIVGLHAPAVRQNRHPDSRKPGHCRGTSSGRHRPTRACWLLRLHCSAFPPTRSRGRFRLSRRQAVSMQVTYQVGAGLQGHRASVLYRMGSAQFCRELVPDFPVTPDDHRYWIGLCRAGAALAWIGLDDSIRPEAGAVIGSARRMGLHVELLTGDSSSQGPLLARALGIETVQLRPDAAAENGPCATVAGKRRSGGHGRRWSQ